MPRSFRAAYLLETIAPQRTLEEFLLSAADLLTRLEPRKKPRAAASRIPCVISASTGILGLVPKSNALAENYKFTLDTGRGRRYDARDSPSKRQCCIEVRGGCPNLKKPVPDLALVCSEKGLVPREPLS